MTSAATPARLNAPRLDGVAVAAAAATLICAAPAIAVIALALTGESGAEFGAALIRDGAIGTLGLVLAGGAGAIMFGAAAAWLVQHGANAELRDQEGRTARERAAPGTAPCQ